VLRQPHLLKLRLIDESSFARFEERFLPSSFTPL